MFEPLDNIPSDADPAKYKQITVNSNGVDRVAFVRLPYTIDDPEYKDFTVQTFVDAVRDVRDTRKSLYESNTDPLFILAYVMAQRGKTDKAAEYTAQAQAKIVDIKSNNPYPVMTQEVKNWGVDFSQYTADTEVLTIISEIN
jgi:hypothetical protein